MWDDDERKGEGETRCRLIACSSRKASRGPPGLTSPFDGRIAFNSTIYKFKYQGVNVDIREEIKRSINIGNACYYPIEFFFRPSYFPED